MVIFVASDHRGYSLKRDLLPRLEDLGYTVVDCGNSIYDESDDFVDFVRILARKIQDQEGLGIVICGSGCGVCISANRFSHLRASVGWDLQQIASDCHDDHINVLALPADYASTQDAFDRIKIFIEAPRSTQPNYVRRIEKLTKLK